MGGVRSEFTPTLWSLVLQAREHSREALEKLLQAYWKPVYFFIRRRGTDVDEAKDLCQGFFTRFLERDSLKGVSREKGRFRSWLLAALKNYMINEAEREGAHKRGGGRSILSIDFRRAEIEFAVHPGTRETPERAFTRQWALSSMARALGALAAGMSPAEFEALKPHLAGGPAYGSTAERLGISPSQLNNLIHRTRKRYRELLRQEVAGSLSDPELIDQEVRDLLDAVKS